MYGTLLAQKKSDIPKVILVLVDDMGWMDLSCQGSDFYRTPNIDRSRRKGSYSRMVTRHVRYVPHPGGSQTGRYPHRLGVTDWIRLFSKRRTGNSRENPTEYVGKKNQKLLCRPIPIGWKVQKLPRGSSPEMDTRLRTLGNGIWAMKRGIRKTRDTIRILGLRLWTTPSFFDPYNNPKHKHPTIQAGIHKLPGRKKGEYLTHREADEAVASSENGKISPSSPSFPLCGAHSDPSDPGSGGSI